MPATALRRGRSAAIRRMPVPIDAKGLAPESGRGPDCARGFDPQADQAADTGDRDQNRAQCQGFVGPDHKQHAGADAAQDHGDIAGHFQQAVSLSQLAGRQHLRQNAELGRTEKCRLGGQQKQDRQQSVHITGNQGHDRKPHDRDLQRLGGHQNAAFTEPVGRIAGISGEEQVRDDEHDAGQRQIAAGPDGGIGGVNRHQRDQHLEQVVVVGAQELSGEQTAKAAVPQGSVHVLLGHGPS